MYIVAFGLNLNIIMLFNSCKLSISTVAIYLQCTLQKVYTIFHNTLHQDNTETNFVPVQTIRQVGRDIASFLFI